MRNVLGISRWTAVIALNSFCPLHDGGRLNGGDVYHLLSMYYDLPVVSLKYALLTKARVREALKGYGYSHLFSSDDVHPNEKGHSVAALLLFFMVFRTHQTVMTSASTDLLNNCATLINSTGATEERCYVEDSFAKYETRRRRFAPEQVMNDKGITKRYTMGSSSSYHSQCQVASQQSGDHALTLLSSNKWPLETRVSRYNNKKYYYRAAGSNATISFHIHASRERSQVLLYYLRSHYTSGVARCHVHSPTHPSDVILPHTIFDSHMLSAGGVGHITPFASVLPTIGEYVIRCDIMEKGNGDFRIIGIILA